MAPANSLRMVFGNVQWIKAADYPDLLSLLQQHSGQKIRLMGANTGTGRHFKRVRVPNDMGFIRLTKCFHGIST